MSFSSIHHSSLFPGPIGSSRRKTNETSDHWETSSLSVASATSFWSMAGNSHANKATSLLALGMAPSLLGNFASNQELDAKTPTSITVISSSNAEHSKQTQQDSSSPTCQGSSILESKGVHDAVLDRASVEDDISALDSEHDIDSHSTTDWTHDETETADHDLMVKQVGGQMNNHESSHASDCSGNVILDLIPGLVGVAIFCLTLYVMSRFSHAAQDEL